ncbi:MAG: S9 family peptidase [Bacteroidota bacterium]|nr:S9 family peptidase [Bacteroidota bacterium]
MRSPGSRLLYILFISLAISTSLTAQGQRKQYTITEHIKLLIPSEPVISPLGDKVIFTIKKPDLNESKWNTQVYLMDISGNGIYRQISPDGESCTEAQFSPDQKWVTFLSSREYKDSKTGNSNGSSTQQLWAVSLKGEYDAASNWTTLKNDVEEFVWSDDSKKIALLSDEFNEQLENEKQMSETKKINAKVFPHENPSKVITIIDAETRQIIKEIKLDPGARSIRFNHDGSKIIYQTNYTGEFNDEQKFDIFAAGLDGNKTQLTKAEGPETLPSYSPDDKKVAYISQIIPDIEFAETDLCVMDNDGKNSVNLTKDFNLSVSGFFWKDKENILFTVKERTEQHLYKVNIKSGKIDKLNQGGQIISNVSLSKDSKHMAYRSEDNASLPEIFADGKILTSFTSQLDQFSLGKQEVITYRSKDNKFDIDALVLKPKDFDPSKKYPLILMLHGGPYGAVRNAYNQTNAARVFTEQGYVVLMPNPRGSEGYSSEFSLANRYDLGGGDYEDLMAGVDYIISKGYIDQNNMGVTGGSYGGYLTDWVISQTNRFKAAVSMFGIFNFITDWSNSFQPAFEKMYFGYYYWERPLDKDNLYLSRSPFFYAKNIKTPTLILQGEKDQYTDVSNSREMYQVMHALGVPVEFVIYPRAGHGIKNEPNQYIDSIERAIRWFNKYLK